MRILWSRIKSIPPNQSDLFGATGEPLLVAIDRVEEDADNPRTDFRESELAELAVDIRARGILQPIVVAAADAGGSYRVRLGAKRLRAAKLAGLAQVPVTITHVPLDDYTQVAENIKRHGLTPLDFARFLQRHVDAGESNGAIAKRLGIDQTTIAHHLALLSLPPVVDAAFQSGRCTSPRTLYELSKLHEDQPERVAEFVGSDADITRAAVAALRTSNDAQPALAVATPQRVRATPATSLVEQAESLCDRLDAIVVRLLATQPLAMDADGRSILRRRIADIAERIDC